MKMFAFGYVRLAIRGLDIQHNQPIITGTKVSFSNGEVYSNNGEKISETINDLEPLVIDIESKKEKIFDEYDADFAICQYDKDTRRFFLARDLFGVKPLFYTWLDNDTLAFCSEIKGLKLLKKKEISYNNDTILDYIVFGYPVNYKTFYEGINAFPPNSIFEWDLIKNSRKMYFSKLMENIRIKTNQVSSKENIYEPLKEAIKNRLQSDRKLGIHLSGGLDSSLVAEIIKQLEEEQKNAYTVFRQYDDNDLIYSKKVINNSNFNHIKIKMSENKDIEEMIKILDSPIMSSGAFVPNIIAKTANKNKDSVLLEGQGADELFLGYSRFKEIDHKMSNENLIELITNSDIEMLQDLFPTKNMRNIIFNEYVPLINLETKNNYEKIQKFYMENFLTELLHIEDHMHMKASIENRVPYLALPILKWIEKNGINFNKNSNKEAILNTHIKISSSVKDRVIKQNMNGNLNLEMQKRNEELSELLEHKIFEEMDYKKLEEYIQNISKLSKKETFTLWTLYNVLIWFKTNEFKGKIRI